MPLPTGYAFFNIMFEVTCILQVLILLYKQRTVFNENAVQKAFTHVLNVQLLYFGSFIIRVLIDVSVLPKTQFSVYTISIINFALFGYCAYRVFVYLELYQHIARAETKRGKLIYAVPFIINMCILFTTPLTGLYISVDADANMNSGPIWLLMVAINCFYPMAGLIAYLYRRRKGLLVDAPNDFKVTVAFPLFFIIFGSLSSLQWRIPILPFGLIIADQFVYIHYTDILMRERNQSLQAERDLAETQNQAKSAFLSNMSHDLRTPMNAIIGYTELARREGTNEAQVREYMEKINSSSHQLLALINDILEMSRIESGKLLLEPVPTDLVRTMEDVKDMFVTQMITKGIDFTVKTDGLENRWVECDRNRLNRVLLNLLSNAVKFTPEGGRVSVVLNQTKRDKEKEEASYSLHVIDTGIGMSPEFAENLFAPFERERTSTVSRIQGTGLGLSITKNILDLMGGEIEVKTEQGRGSEFIVYLTFPVMGEFEDDTAPDEVRQNKKEIDFAGTRALIVEDNEINLEIAKMILADAGFILETAENGKIAVDKVTSAEPGHYDFILMDIQMPEMDGYTATKTIRAMEDSRKAAVPIIAMTANAFAEDVKAAEEAGMDGHIAKPLDINQMMDTISRVLHENR